MEQRQKICFVRQVVTNSGGVSITTRRRELLVSSWLSFQLEFVWYPRHVSRLSITVRFGFRHVGFFSSVDRVRLYWSLIQKWWAIPDCSFGATVGGFVAVADGCWRWSLYGFAGWNGGKLLHAKSWLMVYKFSMEKWGIAKGTSRSIST